jgi:small subunit ribosomal protein S10
MIPTEKIRIRLKAYDHKLLDQSTHEIVDTARQDRLLCCRTDSAADFGEKVLYSPFAPCGQEVEGAVRDEDAPRLLDILEPTQQTIDLLMKLELSAGVDVEIKLP